jgi:predicted 2-oxoglutarate/Fe(II)-dependent dioxygenase YbiX
MDKFSLLTSLGGLFVEKNFLEPELCSRIRDEIHSAPNKPAKIHRANGEYLVDEKLRKTQSVKVLEQTKSLVSSRLHTLKTRLEAHFRLALTDCDEQYFLLYKQGDFFGPHKDTRAETNTPDLIKRRRVSVVIFLNEYNETPADNSYCGGSLTFYGLIQDPRAAKYCFPLTGEIGLLVAFRSDIIHEVKPITWGERYTIVTWFLQ